MPRNKIPIALAPLRRLSSQNGTGSISTAALEELSTILEQYAKDIAKRSAELAEHSGRSTIMPKDVQLSRSN